MDSVHTNTGNNITPTTSQQLAPYSRSQLKTILRKLGADSYDLSLPETHILTKVLLPGEQVIGIVYGRYVQSEDNIVGRGALVATDRRVILLDKKPLFLRSDEIEYQVISAVEHGNVGFISSVAVHTRMGGIAFRTFNDRCARQFVQAVAERLFDSEDQQRGDF